MNRIIILEDQSWPIIKRNTCIDLHNNINKRKTSPSTNEFRGGWPFGIDVQSFFFTSDIYGIPIYGLMPTTTYMIAAKNL